MFRCSCRAEFEQLDCEIVVPSSELRVMGRLAGEEVLQSRATLKSGGQWSLLKRLYLQRLNRPCLDLLVHELHSKAFINYFDDYGSVIYMFKEP